jgi:acyl-CoA synthetase (AMP-forming)/AMP-acid ligase II
MIEIYCAAGLWQRRRFYQMIDEFAVQTPDKLAIADQTKRLTYAELAAAGNALASFLLERGIRAGEPVAVQAGSSADLFIGHVACSRAGFIFIPMSTAWGRRELEHILTLSRAAARLPFRCAADSG